MKYLFLLLPVLGVSLTGCDTMRAMENNKRAIQCSSAAICENIRAIEEANQAIEENRRQLEEINKSLQNVGQQ